MADKSSWIRKKFLRGETARASLLLFFVLNICFFPSIWGKQTLLDSAQDAPSILFQGSWAGGPKTPALLRVLDPGAAAWQNEAWIKLIHHEYFDEKTLPLWNASQGYGQPLAANMQSQPFYPLTILLSLHVTPKTYNWFLLSRLFIAGLCMYLYARCFLSFLASCAAGVMCMLGGYYVLHLTISHLSVEVLLPLGLLAAELMLRDKNFLSIVLFAAMVFLVFAGGMPESAFLLFVFVYAYWCFRVLSDPAFRAFWLLNAGNLVSATVAGLSLAMFILLPFYEYLKGSSHSHGGNFKSGLLYDKFDLSAATYVLPLLYGLPHSDSLAVAGTLNRNYLGVVSLFLILAACAVVIRHPRGASVLKQLTIFFFSCMALIAMKRYGVEPVNQIGRLPLFELVEFRKYAEPILSLCAAMICAIGVEWIIRRETSRALNLVSLGATLVVTTAMAYHSLPIVKGVLLKRHPISPSLWAILLASALLFGVAVCLWFADWIPEKASGRPRLHSSPILGACFLTLIVIQACCCYIIPVYYRYSPPPRRSNNPYVGAPFIDFLKAKSADSDRIFGRDGVLVANWSSAFGLYDIRDHDAMYVHQYFPFLDNFFPDYQRMGPELESTFRGLGSYEFVNPLEQRLLQLSSVRFLATERAYVLPDARIEEILRQNSGHLLPGKENQISHNDFGLNGSVRSGLGEHPPYARLPFRIRVGSGTRAIFHFSYGINPQTYDKGGDGVGFTLEARDDKGKITPLFTNYIDPKQNAAQRGWMTGSVDLKAFSGESIDLLFSTDPGPKGDTSYDWASWSDLHFEGDPVTTAVSPFKQIYDGAARIFQYDRVLPRAAIFYSADLLNDDRAVLQKLGEPSFDVFREVVLNSSNLNPDQLKEAQGLTGMPETVIPAKIVSYRSRKVNLEANLNRSGILMLNDTAYPGWIVKVDHNPSRWFPADYLFRAVFLKPGKHLVEFSYEPASFYYGAAVSATAASLLIILGLGRAVKSRPLHKAVHRG